MTSTGCPAEPTLTDRFGWIADGLCKLFFSRMFPGSPLLPLMSALHRRVRLVQRRFAHLAALYQAGKLPPPRTQATRRANADRPDPDSPPARAKPSLYPRGVGWLRRMFPWHPGLAHHGAAYGHALRALLSDPEAEALLQAAPQLSRSLRPLCRMLGCADIPALQPQPRSSGPRAPNTRPRRPPPEPGAPPRHSLSRLRRMILSGRRVPNEWFDHIEIEPT